jgi:hypothetical protein
MNRSGVIDDILIPHKAMKTDECSWLGGLFEFSRDTITNGTFIRETMDFLEQQKTSKESGWKYACNCLTSSTVGDLVFTANAGFHLSFFPALCRNAPAISGQSSWVKDR